MDARTAWQNLSRRIVDLGRRLSGEGKAKTGQVLSWLRKKTDSSLN
jgi:hypothetical protein